MSLSIHERHLADRYLNGELSGLELEEFKARLESDAAFKQAVELQKVIYAGIAYAREEEIKKKIKASINYRRSHVPFGLKLILVFLIILILGITFWSYLGNEFEKFKPYDNFISLFKNQAKQDTAAKKKPMNVIKTERIPSGSFQSADTAAEDTIAANVDTTDASALTEEDIEVKKDIIITTRLIPVIDKGAQKDESLSKDVAQKLPDADLPTDERVDTFTVEFWASPIHYKGYKMSKNKIVLFGIENFEDVKLYRVNTSIYMRYDESWFPLTITYDFTAYQKLKDTEIPAELK